MLNSFRFLGELVLFDLWIPNSGFWILISASGFRLPDFRVALLRMDVVDLGRKVDRMLLPVTAAIYQNGVEKSAMRWTFEMAIGAISDQNLHGFLQR